MNPSYLVILGLILVCFVVILQLRKKSFNNQFIDIKPTYTPLRHFPIPTIKDDENV